MKIPIETETREVQANGWVDAGLHHTAMFCHPQPANLKGCPCGRSQASVDAAIADLVARTNDESGTRFTPADLQVTRHNGQAIAKTLTVRPVGTDEEITVTIPAAEWEATQSPGMRVLLIHRHSRDTLRGRRFDILHPTTA